MVGGGLVLGVDACFVGIHYVSELIDTLLYEAKKPSSMADPPCFLNVVVCPSLRKCSLHTLAG